MQSPQSVETHVRPDLRHWAYNTGPSGARLGPTLGGWIIDSYSWRWVFHSHDELPPKLAAELRELGLL